MSEEEKNECKCLCHSKGFRKFIVTALGTFVGVYCALALFAAIHRPPMPPCPCGCGMMPPQPVFVQRFDGPRHHGDFLKGEHKKMDKLPPMEDHKAQ